MGYALSKRSWDRMRSVDPILAATVVLALRSSRTDFGIQEEQSRTHAEQLAKVNAGYSKTMASKHMIPPGKSFSTAVDLVPWIDGAFQWGDDQWRVRTKAGTVVEPFYDIAAAMREAAIKTGVTLVWGAVWDKTLNELPPGPAAMKAAVEAYKARRKAIGKPAFLDGPHFEILP